MNPRKTENAKAAEAAIEALNNSAIDYEEHKHPQANVVDDDTPTDLELVDYRRERFLTHPVHHVAEAMKKWQTVKKMLENYED